MKRPTIDQFANPRDFQLACERYADHLAHGGDERADASDEGEETRTDEDPRTASTPAEMRARYERRYDSILSRHGLSAPAREPQAQPAPVTAPKIATVQSGAFTPEAQADLNEAGRRAREAGF